MTHIRHYKVGRGGPMIERRTFGSRGPGFQTTFAVSKLGQLRSPHFACVSGGDSKSRWSLLSGTYARGAKYTTQGNGK